MGYPVSIVKIIQGIPFIHSKDYTLVIHNRYERERVKERERNKIEIDTYLFVKRNKQIKLGLFRQK